MKEKPHARQILDLYLRHVISEASESSEDLRGSFLIRKAFQGKYIKVQILFVCDTDQVNVETEIETWLKIYKWIEDKKDEMLHRYKIEDRNMIVMYPRFISFKEYWSLPRFDKSGLDDVKIAWYKSFRTMT